MKLKRKFYILKCRASVLFQNLAEKILLRLSKWGWVHCHKVTYTNIKDCGSVQYAPDLVSSRYIFSVSYILRRLESVSEYWFETKKGKRIFTVDESYHAEGRVSYKADLKSFFAHFSPRQKMWVHSNSPVIQFSNFNGYLSKSPFSNPVPQVEVKTHRCDFSQCRFAFEFSYALDMPSEVLPQSYRVLGNQLTSKVSEINKILTGADHDGEMVSPKNMPLSENLLCRQCGLPVFASAEDKYHFECLNHGELYYDKVMRVDPVEYQKVLGYNLDTLEALIKKSCPQD